MKINGAKVNGTKGAKINGTKGAWNLRSGNGAGKMRLETAPGNGVSRQRSETTLGDDVDDVWKRRRSRARFERRFRAAFPGVVCQRRYPSVVSRRGLCR